MSIANKQFLHYFAVKNLKTIHFLYKRDVILRAPSRNNEVSKLPVFLWKAVRLIKNHLMHEEHDCSFVLVFFSFQLLPSVKCIR